MNGMQFNTKSNEAMYITFTKTYNTKVFYYGNNPYVLDFLRGFDIWSCQGQRTERDGFRNANNEYIETGSWIFECSKAFYVFAKDISFYNYCQKHDICVVIQ